MPDFDYINDMSDLMDRLRAIELKEDPESIEEAEAFLNKLSSQGIMDFKNDDNLPFKVLATYVFIQQHNLEMDDPDAYKKIGSFDFNILSTQTGNAGKVYKMISYIEELSKYSLNTSSIFTELMDLKDDAEMLNKVEIKEADMMKKMGKEAAKKRRKKESEKHKEEKKKDSVKLDEVGETYDGWVVQEWEYKSEATKKVLNTINEEVLATEETPMEEETPVEEETHAEEETSIEEETPVAEETPAEEETPIAKKTSAAAETPMAEEAPAEEEAPIAEEAPVAEETPAEGDAPVAKEKTTKKDESARIRDEVPSDEETPIAKKKVQKGEKYLKTIQRFKSKRDVMQKTPQNYVDTFDKLTAVRYSIRDELVGIRESLIYGEGVKDKKLAQLFYGKVKKMNSETDQKSLEELEKKFFELDGKDNYTGMAKAINKCIDALSSENSVIDLDDLDGMFDELKSAATAYYKSSKGILSGPISKHGRKRLEAADKLRNISDNFKMENGYLTRLLSEMGPEDHTLMSYKKQADKYKESGIKGKEYSAEEIKDYKEISALRTKYVDMVSSAIPEAKKLAEHYSVLAPTDRYLELGKGVSPKTTKEKAAWYQSKVLFDNVFENGLTAQDIRKQMEAFNGKDEKKYVKLIGEEEAFDFVMKNAGTKAFSKWDQVEVLSERQREAIRKKMKRKSYQYELGTQKAVDLMLLERMNAYTLHAVFAWDFDVYGNPADYKKASLSSERFSEDTPADWRLDKISDILSILSMDDYMLLQDKNAGKQREKMCYKLMHRFDNVFPLVKRYHYNVDKEYFKLGNPEETSSSGETTKNAQETPRKQSLGDARGKYIAAMTDLYKNAFVISKAYQPGYETYDYMYSRGKNYFKSYEDMAAGYLIKQELDRIYADGVTAEDIVKMRATFDKEKFRERVEKLSNDKMFKGWANKGKDGLASYERVIQSSKDMHETLLKERLDTRHRNMQSVINSWDKKENIFLQDANDSTYNSLAELYVNNLISGKLGEIVLKSLYSCCEYDGSSFDENKGLFTEVARQVLQSKGVLRFDNLSDGSVEDKEETIERILNDKDYRQEKWSQYKVAVIDPKVNAKKADESKVSKDNRDLSKEQQLMEQMQQMSQTEESSMNPQIEEPSKILNASMSEGV